MGKDNGKGITARASSIRINFYVDGKRHYETLALVPTPANMKYAANLRKQILHRIEMGTFSLAEFFPDSKNATVAKKKTFAEIAEEWLNYKRNAVSRKGQKGLAETTLSEYRGIIRHYFLPVFADTAMEDIKFLEIGSVLNNLGIGVKGYNNLLTVLRGIFAYAIEAEIITKDYSRRFKFGELPKANPDPLKPEEIKAVLDDMYKHYPEQVAIYFELAFNMGFRPSEGIDLRWANVDWNEKTILINSARVRRTVKATKTYVDRTVELDDHCMSLLRQLKPITFMRGERLFFNPVTDKPYASTDFLVQKYWHPTLKRCGIRLRDARQTRHTCASMILMAGGADAERWGAERLGHSVVEFRNTYSKWLPEVDKRRQLSKLSAMLREPGEDEMFNRGQ